MRRLALVLTLLALGLAACGGGGGNSDTDQIKSAYAKLFSSKSSVSERVAVLQDGPRFRALVASFANNPLAKNVTATVSSVTPHGNTAKVVYTVKLGSSALPTQTGSAVKQNGTWKVGYASLCRLVALEGSTPAVCKKP